MTAPAAPATAALTPRRVPESYVRGEVASFPLTGVCAFTSALMELDPEVGAQGGGPTLTLWRECEKLLVEHASGWSLDRIIAVRDCFWFACGDGCQRERRPAPLSMLRYLRHLAQAHLEARPGSTDVVHGMDTNASDALTHYRWLTFALPEDLLLAAVDADPPPTRVDLEPPMLLRRLLDKGVAEIHHHIGAGMDFPLLWVSALSALADPGLPPTALESPALVFGHSELLLRWMLAAAVSRCVLAEFLVGGRSPGQRPPVLGGFLEGLEGSPAWTPYRLRVLVQTLHALAKGQHSGLPEYRALQELYGDLHPEALRTRTHPPTTVAEVWRRCDPIAVRFALATPNAGERWLVHEGLRYLEQRERARRDDPLFRQLFWQTLRVRCLYYRAVVQRPMTAGLQWFVRFYGRLGKLRDPLRFVRPEVSYMVAGRTQPIAALEVRTGAGDSPLELARELRGLTYSWRHVLSKMGGITGGLSEPEFGVLVHFIKERDPEHRWGAGKPPAFGRRSHAEPQRRGSRGGRYTDYYAEQAGKARALAELLQVVPLALWLVRGLDVASDELSVETWVLVPLYRYVQHEAARAAVTPLARHAPPFRLTAHVGEDFRHLMEGLRHVFECIQYLLDRMGGRLGHATALGVEPRVWAESVGSVMMPAEARLWDLVFEWRLYSSYRIPPELRAIAPPGRPEQVENLIEELSGRIFRSTYSPQELAESHHVLHHLFTPPVARGPPDGTPDGFVRALRNLDPEHVRFPDRVRSLLECYRTDEDAFVRGQALVDVALDGSEVAALYAVQDALRRAVGARGIVVEVNPSSNLLIGDLMDLRSHPILRLFPPEPQPGAPPPVPIAVGSDDPVTFSTYLLREYALLYEAAHTAGYPERAVHEWLATIRQTSMDARFTAAWFPSARDMAGRLLDAFDDFLQRPRRVDEPGPGRDADGATRLYRFSWERGPNAGARWRTE